MVRICGWGHIGGKNQEEVIVVVKVVEKRLTISFNEHLLEGSLYFILKTFILLHSSKRSFKYLFLRRVIVNVINNITFISSIAYITIKIYYLLDI